VLILEHLLTGLKDACAAFPDKRKSAGVYSMADKGRAMSAIGKLLRTVCKLALGIVAAILIA
jgi:hypothetical protein